MANFFDNARKSTNKIMELIDEGMLDKDEVLLTALNYLSEADVTEMAYKNDWIDEDKDTDFFDDWEDDE